MDMAAANESCGAPEPVFDDCPACRGRVGLHCAECKIQVTGCTCTEAARFDPLTAWEATCQRLGEDEARKAYKSAGIPIPGEGLILP
jgi:hypothetical protein